MSRMATSGLGAGDYAVIGCMLAVSASVGIYFRFSGGRQKTAEEYLMAGKTMSIGPVAFSLMATFMSAIAILGISAEIYVYGTQLVLSLIGTSIGSILAAYGFLPVFFTTNVTTAYEYLEKRFGKTTRAMAGFLFIIQMMLYMAVAIYAPSVALSAVTELSTWTSVLLLIVVATFYCYLGGLKAVLWTDVFQGILMYIPIMAVVFYVAINLGINEIYRRSNDSGQIILLNMTFDPTARYTFWNVIIYGMFSGCSSYCANQAQMQRILCVGNLKKGRRALFWSVPLILIFNVFCYLAGIVTYAIYHDCDPILDPRNNLTSQDQIIPYSILKMFSNLPGIPGLCLAGILSAALSTVSSTLNSLCSVALEDFFKPYCCMNLKENWLSHIAKLMAIFFGLLCLLLVFIVSNFRGVFEATSVLNGFLSGPVFGVYLLGLFSSTANEHGIIVGLISGITFTGWIAFGSYLAKVPIPNLPRSIEECPLSANETLGVNKMSSSDIIPEMRNLTYDVPKQSSYTFPLYKLSYLWYPIIGIVITFVFGYLASFVAKFWINPPIVDRNCLSPFVQRFHECSSKSGVTNKEKIPKEDDVKEIPSISKNIELK